MGYVRGRCPCGGPGHRGPCAAGTARAGLALAVVPSRIVLFDLDGTLTDSQAGIVASFRHALGSFGLDADAAAIRRWIGPPLVDGLAALGVPAGELDAAVAVYRAYFSTTGLYENRLYDGVDGLLRRLGDAGVTMGVATSKLTPFARRITEHFGIAARFRVVAGGSVDGRRVRKEDVVAHALERLGAPDASTVALVGDRGDDMRAAGAHGLAGIGVTWGYGTPQELADAGAAHLVSSPDELAALLLPSVSPRRRG